MCLVNKEATLHFQEMNELSPTILERCLSLVFSLGAEREITARKISVHTQYKGHLTWSLKEEATARGKAAVKQAGKAAVKQARVSGQRVPSLLWVPAAMWKQVWGRGAGGIDHSSRELKDPDLYVDPDFKM